MQALDSNVLVIALPTIGFIVWLIRLEGRVNTSEQRFSDLKEDVTYIRERIDNALDK